jgi:hypothetical protein
MMNRKHALKAALCGTALGLFALAATPAAFAQCVGPTGGSADGEGVDSGYLTDAATQGYCNVLITFGPNGAITTTDPNKRGFYDTGGDDNLVGVINNSGHTITAFGLNGGAGNDIFGFDFDGICSTYNSSGGSTGGGFTFSPSASPCGGATDPNQYGTNLNGVNVTFNMIGNSNTTGNVILGSGLLNGGFAEFSLEGPASLTATGVTPPIPEPNSLILLGSGLLGLVEFGRRKLRA